MEYEKKYKEALKWVQKLYPSFEGWVKEDAEHYFPELKSEDEKIRKAIHIYLDWLDGRKDYQPKGAYTIKNMIAWLEKQGEQKTDPCTDCTNDKGCVTCEHGELRETHTRTLNADKVIEWLERNAIIFWHSPCNPNIIVKHFKEDFEL